MNFSAIDAAVYPKALSCNQRVFHICWQRKVQRDACMCKALTVYFSHWELSSYLCSERVPFSRDGHFGSASPES